MKFKKKLLKALCCSFVFLTCLYSFYVPSYALDQTAFKLRGMLSVNGVNDAINTQYVPMTQGIVYDLYTSDENKVQIDSYCNVDTGNGFFTNTARFGAYYTSSNCNFSFTLRFYYSSDGTDIYPGTVFYGFPDGSEDIAFSSSIYFSEGFSRLDSSYFSISPRRSEFDPYFNDVVVFQDIVCSMNLKLLYPDRLIQRVQYVFVLPEQYGYGSDVVVDEPAFIRVSFQEFSLGNISIDQGNLDEVQQAEQMGQEYQQQVQNMSGIGNVPTVDPIGLVQGSSEFMRWASHTYSIPVLSSMIAITLSFSILFFLLKKR